jgi:hypothetical protein
MNEITTNEKFQDLISEKTPRRLAAKIPKKVYLYFPKPTEIVEWDENRPTKTMRRIFEGVTELLPFEKEKFEGFKKYVEDNNASARNESEQFRYPDYWSDDQTLRALQSYEYDYRISLENIIKYIEWRRQTLPIQPSNKICDILNLGFIYTHGRDTRFRPNVVLRIKEFKAHFEKFAFEDWMQAIIFNLEYLIHNLLIKGQVENWNIIVDCQDASIFSIPPDLKKLLGVLSDNYKCRLHSMFILNLSFFLRAIWNIIKGLLDPITQKKIIITSPGDEELINRINKSQLEEKYGGTAPTINEHFFPHIQPRDDFTNENESEDILMSEEDYMELVLRDNRIERSPYYKYPDHESKNYYNL